MKYVYVVERNLKTDNKYGEYIYSGKSCHGIFETKLSACKCLDEVSRAFNPNRKPCRGVYSMLSNENRDEKRIYEYEEGCDYIEDIYTVVTYPMNIRVNCSEHFNITDTSKEDQE